MKRALTLTLVLLLCLSLLPSAAFAEAARPSIPSASSYTFYFNANGGSGTMNAVSVAYGKQFTLPANSFTNGSATFQGWNARRNGDGKWFVIGKGWLSETQISNDNLEKAVYPDKAVRTFDASWTYGYNGDSTYTFYAIWDQQKVSTVSFGADFRGPSGDYPTMTIFGLYGTISSTVNLAKIEATVKNADTGEVQTGFLYARNWSSKTYNIHTDGLNDAFIFDKLAAGSFIYSVEATDVNGSTASKSTSFTKGYKISYDANGGTGAPAAQYKLSGASVVLQNVRPTRTGCVFKGWATTNNAATAQYQPGGLYSDNRSVTLYAVWEAYTLTVKYNANGGTASKAPYSSDPSGKILKDAAELQSSWGYGSANKDVLFDASALGLSRSGYTFAGWALSTKSDAKVYDPADESLKPETLCPELVNGNATVTLYAVWEEMTAPVIKEQPESASAKEGEKLSFKVSAEGEELSYQWQYRTSSTGKWKASPAAGNKTATLTVPATVKRNGYQYRCVVKNSAGSVASEPATLTLSAFKPVIKTQPASAKAAEDKTVSFTVAAEGEGLSYQWQYRKSADASWKKSSAEGCKTATLQVTAAAKRDGYQYRCIVKNDVGKVYSKAVTLTVLLKPVIETQPKSVTAKAGSKAIFTVTAKGEELSYQWQYRTSDGGTWKNSPAAGNRTATLKVSVTAKKNGYQYRCVVSGEGGAVTTRAATLSVSKAKLEITAQPKNVSAKLGEKVSFTVKATGTGLSYQWQYRTSSSGSWKNCSSKTEGYQSATLKVKATAKRSGYEYRCAISDSSGTVYSQPAMLAVK